MITEQDKKIVAELAATGMGVREITRTIGEDNTSVCKISRIMNMEEVKAMVLEEQSKFLASLPNARKNVQGLIDNYDCIKDNNERDRAWKSSMEMLRAAGFLPSKNMSVVLQQMNIYHGGDQMISPEVMKVLSAFTDDLCEPVDKEEIEDAETEGN